MFFIALFVIVYVWQNIEVVKTKMEYEQNLRIKDKLIKQNDKLLYEIEKERTYVKVKSYAERDGIKKITPNDIEVLKVEKK